MHAHARAARARPRVGRAASDALARSPTLHGTRPRHRPLLRCGRCCSLLTPPISSSCGAVRRTSRGTPFALIHPQCAALVSFVAGSPCGRVAPALTVSRASASRRETRHEERTSAPSRPRQPASPGQNAFHCHSNKSVHVTCQLLLLLLFLLLSSWQSGSRKTTTISERLWISSLQQTLGARAAQERN